MSNNRLIQFDILKGVGIVCVLLGHTEINDILAVQIYAFHMPLFFFCGGVFFRDRTLRETLRKSVNQLLIPYFFFLFVRYACLFVLYVMTGKSYDYVDNILLTTNPLDESGAMYKTIWFLLCLFSVRLLYAVIDKIVKLTGDNRKLLLESVLCVGGYVAAPYLELPFCLDSAIGMLLYYHMGRIFFSFDTYKKNIGWFYILLMMVVYVVAVYNLHPHVSIKNCIYPVYHVFWAILGIYTFYQISIKLIELKFVSHFLARCGNSSLTLMGLHRSLWLFICPICLALHMSDWFTIIIQMVIAIVVILPVDVFLKKYSPWLIGAR